MFDDSQRKFILLGMGGCRCSYKTCTNTTSPGKLIHFFHYPVKSPDICKQWIKNAGKSHFSLLAEDQLKNKVVCENHFEDRLFTNAQKKRLLKGAIPTLDGCNLQPRPLIQQKYLPSTQTREDATSKINLLSANDDATLFVLDTSAINLPHTSNADKVESYIYQNGSLVPINSNSSTSESREYMAPSPTADFTPNHGLYEDIEDNKNDVQSILLVEAENSQQQPSYSLLYSESSHDSIDVKPGVSNHSASQSKIMAPLRKRIASVIQQEPVQLEKKKVPPPKTNGIESEYIQKINEHSREIADIKRLLQKCTCIKRPFLTKYSILNSIKRLIPPSLFAVLKVHLIRRPSAQDLAFFISIYEKSPEVYNMLSDECHWNLPDIESLKSLMKHHKD